MTEAKLRIEVMTWLRNRSGVWAVKYPGSMYGEAGTPDVLACVRGRFVAIELKMPGKKPTKIQDVQLRRIIAAGGRAVVATTLDDVINIVTSIEGDDERWK